MLNSSEIRRLIEEEQLIANYIHRETQLQPSGFDLSLGEVLAYTGGGSVDFYNVERVIASTTPIEPDDLGWYDLDPGCYVIIYNEVVRIPLDIVALARTRSTLLRNGASVGTAVWDPGYQGRSSSLLVVHNPHGIRLKRDARVVQLIFFRTEKVDEGYRGIYQKERMGMESSHKA
ncbi:MAG: deoxyuridine 5'-triphosphate nucleotidohydrolase [Candidatus Bathyarchaeota archaeon]|nr:MAG: deoxyuridine 5'-triphosphate nucleotidohydrolase [Candidatus Bathyarchaeota archaeon]